ncbi:MAG: PepSY domain-containing protein [Gammaproteobacteria bacterium]|nr:PepSY domain-containing protein [Gammaproteobacteria bacterium]
MRNLLAPLLMLLPALALADASIQDCLHAVTAIRPGKFVKVEYLGVTDERQAAYEIEVKPARGRHWEFECSARSGAIIEMEQEVESVDDPLFKATMKVDEKQAVATATNLYPGEVQEIEYEIDANGSPRYEVDVIDLDSIQLKIEVSAVTGKIEEVQIEMWEIGEEGTRK